MRDLGYLLQILLSGLLILANVSAESYHGQRKFGPNKLPTRGEVWPQPQLVKTYGDSFMVIRPPLFKFKVVRNNCGMIEEAIKRYYSIIKKTSNLKTQSFGSGDIRTNTIPELYNKTWKQNENFKGFLDTIYVDIMTKCEDYPHQEMDESYEIRIDSPDGRGEGLLTASTNWGIIRGLETLSQLLHPTDDFTAVQIKSTIIVDYPRFPFRAILIDTSRHFLPKRTIYENLDLMAMNKLNVLHWHIVDDQSFPYQSKTFPALSDLGAYHPYTHVYTQQDVADIIEYARVRGIRVISEFDSPGHTLAWGPGVPGLLTECYGKDGKPDGTYGPIDPTKEENYAFLKTFFQEVASTFPDKFLHLGGDEVEYACWKSNPHIGEFMKAKNFTQYAQLEEYYMQNLVDIIGTFPQKNSYVVWQEVIDNGVKVNKDTIVHVWKHNTDYDAEMAHVTSLGYKTLTYACWYLNYISYGIDWPKYYSCDPQGFNGTDAQKRLVMGGGAAMWGEFVDSTNIIQYLWPRAAAPAERLWSNAKVNDPKAAAPRLEEHRCRLLGRGFKVAPGNGPGFCMTDDE